MRAPAKPTPVASLDPDQQTKPAVAKLPASITVQAGDSLATIAERAGTAARRLRRGATHSLLLAGVTSLYLSGPEARHAHVVEAAEAIRRALGWPVAVLLVVLRARRSCCFTASSVAPDHNARH